jgi:hypothetical protein
MSLNESVSRFIDEQRWCGCKLQLGEPQSVGKIHLAFKSKLLKKLVDAGKTKITDNMGLDKSPEKIGDTDHVEFEAVVTDQGVRDEVTRFDEALRMVPKVHDELKSVQEAILGMHAQSNKIDLLCNNVQALVQSGIPINANLEQLMGIVARQGESINILQQSMLGIIKNMELILVQQSKQK